MTLVQHFQTLLTTVLSYFDVFKDFRLVNWTRGLVASFRPELLPAPPPELTLPTSLSVLEETVGLVDVLPWPAANTPILLAEERHPLVHIIERIYDAWMPRPTYELFTPNLVLMYVSVFGMIVGLSQVSRRRLPSFPSLFSRAPQAEHASPAVVPPLLVEPIVARYVNHSLTARRATRPAQATHPVLDDAVLQNSMTGINTVDQHPLNIRRIPPVISSSPADAVDCDRSDGLRTPVDEEPANLIIVASDSVQASVQALSLALALEAAAEEDGTGLESNNVSPASTKGGMDEPGPSNTSPATSSGLGIRDEHGGEGSSNVPRPDTIDNSTADSSLLTAVAPNTRDPVCASDTPKINSPVESDTQGTPRDSDSLPPQTPAGDDLASTYTIGKDFGRSLLPVDYESTYPLGHLGQLIDEDIDDWTSSLIHIALNEEEKPRVVNIVQPITAPSSPDGHPFVSSSPAVSSAPGKEQHDLDHEDHRRLGSAPSRLSVPDKRKSEADPAPLILPADLAAHWPSVSGRLGLILLDRTAEGLYSKAAIQFALMEEKEALRLATRQRRQRRASSVCPGTPKIPAQGYGLSRHAFLSMYTPLLYVLLSLIVAIVICVLTVV